MIQLANYYKLSVVVSTVYKNLCLFSKICEFLLLQLFYSSLPCVPLHRPLKLQM